MAFVSICISSRGLETGQTPELKHGSTPPPPLPPPLHSVAGVIDVVGCAGGDDAISVSPRLLRRSWLHVRMPGSRLASFNFPPFWM